MKLKTVKGRRLTSFVTALGTALASMTLVVVGATAASAAGITSAGPLTQINISPELNCDVRYAGDTDPEFYGTTACATLLASAGTLYGPSDIPAGASASPRTTYTPISQSTATGAGTLADPYVITTEVGLGSSGLRIVQKDSYVVDQESYRTDITVYNDGSAQASAVLYKAGDCYLQNSDLGYGAYDAATGAVTCVGIDPVTGGPGTRIEQFLPLSPGSNYLEDFFDTVWAAVGTQQPLPDQCAQCSVNIDNGMALSWNLVIPAGASVTRSHLTTFSPTGISPLTTSKTADQAAAAAGAADGYTITVHNPNTTAATLTSITDTLPAGFTYTPGSTTGATTTNPSISGQTLTWSGSFPIAAGGYVTLHFGVTVSSTAGTYYNNATATTESIAVAPTGDTAPVTVSAGNEPPTADAGGPYSGNEGSAVPIAGTANDVDADPLTTAWSYTAGAGVDPGATCSFASASSLSTTVTCTDDGTYELKLEVSDGHHPAVSSTATLTVGNVAPSVTITSPADLSQVLVGSTVNLTSTSTDPGSNDTHTCSIDWGDSSPADTMAGGQCTGSYTYAAIGVYTVTVTVTDDDGGVGTASIGLVVYDSETKVTGGGFVVDGGRTSFGFVAKTGGPGGFEGQLQVRAPGRNVFHGDTVDSLVASDHTATWSGTGSWNHDDGYTFEVSVVDSGKQTGRFRTPDTVSITVRDGSGAVVFSTSGPLKGGNITVH